MDGNGQNGLFITFEGGDGVGKSTQIRFLKELLIAHGHEVVCLREPGGTLIGEQLRKILLNPQNSDIACQTELLLYEAARAQLVAEVIKPALERGAVVISDRFFDSTVAYQAYGRGLSFDFTRAANEFASQGLVPSRTILLTVDGEVSKKRANGRGVSDRIESAGDAFHERVRQGFTELAASEPSRIEVIEASGTFEEVSRRIVCALCTLFPWFGSKDCTSKEVEEFIAKYAYTDTGAC